MKLKPQSSKRRRRQRLSKSCCPQSRYLPDPAGGSAPGYAVAGSADPQLFNRRELARALRC